MEIVIFVCTALLLSLSIIFLVYKIVLSQKRKKNKNILEITMNGFIIYWIVLSLSALFFVTRDFFTDNRTPDNLYISTFLILVGNFMAIRSGLTICTKSGDCIAKRLFWTSRFNVKNVSVIKFSYYYRIIVDGKVKFLFHDFPYHGIGINKEELVLKHIYAESSCILEGKGAPLRQEAYDEARRKKQEKIEEESLQQAII